MAAGWIWWNMNWIWSFRNMACYIIPSIVRRLNGQLQWVEIQFSPVLVLWHFSQRNLHIFGSGTRSLWASQGWPWRSGVAGGCSLPRIWPKSANITTARVGVDAPQPVSCVPLSMECVAEWRGAFVLPAVVAYSALHDAKCTAYILLWFKSLKEYSQVQSLIYSLFIVSAHALAQDKLVSVHNTFAVVSVLRCHHIRKEYCTISLSLTQWLYMMWL